MRDHGHYCRPYRVWLLRGETDSPAARDRCRSTRTTSVGGRSGNCCTGSFLPLCDRVWRGHRVLSDEPLGAHPGAASCDVRPSVRYRRLLFHEPHRCATLERTKISFFFEDDGDWSHHPHFLRGASDRAGYAQGFRLQIADEELVIG